MLCRTTRHRTNNSVQAVCCIALRCYSAKYISMCAKSRGGAPPHQHPKYRQRRVFPEATATCVCTCTRLPLQPHLPLLKDGLPLGCSPNPILFTRVQSTGAANSFHIDSQVHLWLPSCGCFFELKQARTPPDLDEGARVKAVSPRSCHGLPDSALFAESLESFPKPPYHTSGESLSKSRTPTTRQQGHRRP